MKKRIIISLIITCSICSILTGCKITKNKEITEDNEVIDLTPFYYVDGQKVVIE